MTRPSNQPMKPTASLRYSFGVCHDTLPWLISFSLDDRSLSSTDAAFRFGYLIRGSSPSDCFVVVPLRNQPTRNWSTRYFGYMFYVLCWPFALVAKK
jgi:hypothetical protein